MNSDTNMVELVAGEKVIVRVPQSFSLLTCSVLFFSARLMFGGIYEGVYLGDSSFGRNDRVLIDGDDVVIVPKSWIEKNPEGE